MAPVERYYFTLQGQLPDILNKHVISVSLETNLTDEQAGLPYSEIVRKIATSFQKTGTTSNSDRELLSLADKIIQALKNRNLPTISASAHPDKGIRFTPYANVNPEKDLVFKSNQLADLFDENTSYLWGIYDGSGLPINLIFADYYRKFIYDKDYATGEKAVNKLLGQGNTLSNITTVYPDGHFVEYYIAGKDKNAEMDWGSLRLVFEKKQGKWFLVGFVHDQWTI